MSGARPRRLACLVGAACFGVGYAAIALRIGTIWPLMVLHMLTDLFAAVGALPKIPILVGQEVVLLAVGLWLIWRMQGSGRHRDHAMEASPRRRSSGSMSASRPRRLRNASSAGTEPPTESSVART